MNFRWLAEWVWSTVIWLYYPWVNNNYRRLKVDAGKETHVDAQAHGDAGVQLHPWWKVHTPRQCVHESVLYTCTCTTYPYRRDWHKWWFQICMYLLRVQSLYNLEHSVPKAKHCPDWVLLRVISQSRVIHSVYIYVEGYLGG